MFLLKGLAMFKRIITILLLLYTSVVFSKEVITVIYAFSPSDTTANYSRMLLIEANNIQNKYTFIFDAKPGAGGTLAANFVSNTPNTILHHSTAYFVRPNIFPNESWDLSQFKEEFVHCEAPLVVASAKYKSWKDINNKIVTIGISGLGVTTHLMAVQLKKKYPNLNIIPFKSTTDAMMSMLSGNTDLAIGFAGEVKNWEGKMTALGITGQRSYPNFPTLVSQGHHTVFGGMVVGQHYVVPTNWPDDKAREIYNIFNQASKSTVVTDSYRDDFCTPLPTDYKDLPKFYDAKTEYWKKLSIGIKVE